MERGNGERIASIQGALDGNRVHLIHHRLLHGLLHRLLHGLHRLRRIRGLGSRFGNDVHWLRNSSRVVLCVCVEHRCAIGGGLIGAVLLPSDKTVSADLTC